MANPELSDGVGELLEDAGPAWTALQQGLEAAKGSGSSNDPAPKEPHLRTHHDSVIVGRWGQPVVAVVAGVLFDMAHKGSARYFFANMRKSKGKGRQVGGGELASIAVQTAVVDVLASGEFCNPKRRVAHLLGMYGFVFYIVATAVMVFRYPGGAPTPALWPALWWIGAAVLNAGEAYAASRDWVRCRACWRAWCSA